MLEQAIERLTAEVEKLRGVLEKQSVALAAGQATRIQQEAEQSAVENRAKRRDEDAYLDEHAVAALIGLSVASIRRWRLLRTGPPYRKLGSAVRYSRKEVLAWLQEQRPE